MPELLEFSLLDMTPYDRQSWFNLVGDYNQAIWWAYPIVVLLILTMLSLLFRTSKAVGSDKSVRLVLVLLGASWLWCGAVFHKQYFSDLNWAATWFGWAFLFQSGLLLLAAIFMKAASWVSPVSLRGRLAIILLVTGLVIYPLCGLLEGRSFMQLEWFPLLPAPVTLVSIGLLIWLKSRWRHGLAIIPVIWGVVSAAFATTLGLLEFYFMAGALVIWLAHFFVSRVVQELN